ASATSVAPRAAREPNRGRSRAARRVVPGRAAPGPARACILGFDPAALLDEVALHVAAQRDRPAEAEGPETKEVAEELRQGAGLDRGRRRSAVARVRRRSRASCALPPEVLVEVVEDDGASRQALLVVPMGHRDAGDQGTGSHWSAISGRGTWRWATFRSSSAPTAPRVPSSSFCPEPRIRPGRMRLLDGERPATLGFAPAASWGSAHERSRRHRSGSL